MSRPDQQRGCPQCGTPITSVTTFFAMTAEQVLARSGPPSGIPDGADPTYVVSPCGHEASLTQLREAGIEAERFEH